MFKSRTKSFGGRGVTTGGIANADLANMAQGTVKLRARGAIFNADCPFAIRILDAQLRVSTAVGGSSAALRTASAGGGSVPEDT